MTARTSVRALRSRSALLAAVAMAAGAGLTSACSLVFHADAAQCQTNGDCRGRGAAFASTECHAGTCVAMPADAAATDAPTTPATDGSLDAQAEAETEAEAGPPGCNTFADCPTPAGNHSEVTCNPDTHTCVRLTTDQCPVVLGDYQYTRNVGPAVIGAFSPLPPNGGDLTSHPCTRSYKLAIDEFTNGRSGIPAGPGSKLRTPVVVVCNTTSAQITQSMQHLVGDLNVPAVIAALASADLGALFSNYGYPSSAKVFVVNPFGADSTLTAISRGAQFWHMLGLPGDTAPAYQPLLARVETYIRNSGPWNLGSGSLKVASVTANATVLNDLASAALPTLSWNQGSDRATMGDALFASETIPDSVLNGTQSPVITSAVAGIVAFQPHVVISFASDEFVTLLQTVELEWPTSVPKPVWILSSYNYQSTPLLSWANNDPAKLARVIGVNFASTTNSVASNYATNFLAANPSLPTTDYGNCYDATYFAVDSLVGASNLTTRPLTGEFLGQGMLRLISIAGTPYNMGSMDVDNASATLTGRTSSSIKLVGTLGDPEFNAATGARVGQGDVYCLKINPPPAGGTISTSYVPDAMHLVIPGDGGAPSLSGTPCFRGL